MNVYGYWGTVSQRKLVEYQWIFGCESERIMSIGISVCFVLGHYCLRKLRAQGKIIFDLV